MRKMRRYFYTDDPARDADNYFAEQERQLEQMPVCADCGEHITSEFCYVVNDEPICEACMEQYKKYTEDLVR